MEQDSSRRPVQPVVHQDRCKAAYKNNYVFLKLNFKFFNFVPPSALKNSCKFTSLGSIRSDLSVGIYPSVDDGRVHRRVR